MQLGSKVLPLSGLLMFGKEQSIRDAQAVPEYFVDFREKLDPAVRWTDRVYPDGTWEANIFQFYQRVWPKLASGLSSPFQLSLGIRRDETPAHEALREAFVNALVHADYFVAGGVVIERYPDRFVVENPGTLLVSLEQYLRGGVSECRNKALQQMLLMIGGGERAGSGADRIRSGWRERHWRAPRIDTQNQPDRVRLELSMISLIPEEALAALKERYGAAFIEHHVSDSELQALATAYLEDEVSNSRLQELLPDHPSEITRMLQGLCQLGVLESDNRRRWSRYRLGGGGASAHTLFDPSYFSHNAGGSSHLPAMSEVSEEGLLHLLAGPVAFVGKSPASLVRKTIVAICKGRFLTAEHLARLLKRNAAGLRNRYLSPMVTEGLLTLRYPESANRPDQAYTATEYR